jgi:hypothetical protein
MHVKLEEHLFAALGRLIAFRDRRIQLSFLLMAEARVTELSRLVQEVFIDTVSGVVEEV